MKFSYVKIAVLVVLTGVAPLVPQALSVPSEAVHGQFGVVKLDGLSVDGVNAYSSDHRAISCNLDKPKDSVAIRQAADENSKQVGKLRRFERFSVNLRKRKDHWAPIVTTNDRIFNNAGERDGRSKRAVDKGWVEVGFICDYRIMPE